MAAPRPAEPAVTMATELRVQNGIVQLHGGFWFGEGDGSGDGGVVGLIWGGGGRGWL